MPLPQSTVKELVITPQRLRWRRFLECPLRLCTSVYGRVASAFPNPWPAIASVVTPKAAMRGQGKSGHARKPSEDEFVLHRCLLREQVCFCATTRRNSLKGMVGTRSLELLTRTVSR
jgi:hypothetical protein